MADWQATCRELGLSKAIVKNVAGADRLNKRLFVLERVSLISLRITLVIFLFL